MKPRLRSGKNATAVPHAGFLIPESGTLPPATIDYAGQIRFSSGRHYACVEASTGVYAWVGLTPFWALTGTTTWDIGNQADAGDESKNVTVTGAAVGDVCVASVSSLTAALGGSIPGAWEIACNVSAASTCTVSITNQTGTTLNPASGTLRCTVLKAI